MVIDFEKDIIFTELTEKFANHSVTGFRETVHASKCQIENVHICEKGTMPLCSKVPTVQQCGDFSTSSKAYCPDATYFPLFKFRI